MARKYRKLVNLISILPLAFPMYLMCFSFLTLTEYSSPLATWTRDFLGIVSFHKFTKNAMGCGFIFSLGLSPYLFILLKSRIGKIPRELFLVSSLLNKSFFELLQKLIFPWLKRSFLFGSMVITMEVLSDFGGVAILNYKTFSLAIYESWLDLFSVKTALSLSLIPLAISLVLFFLIKKGSQKNESLGPELSTLIEIPPIIKNLSWFILVVFFFFQLILPLCSLAYNASNSLESSAFAQLIKSIWQTTQIGLMASLLLAITGLVFLFWKRYNRMPTAFIQLAKTGYALPGSMVAISVLFLIKVLKLELSGFWAWPAIGLALSFKFFPVIFNPIELAQEGVSRKFDLLSQSLGKPNWDHMKRVLFPSISNSFYLGCLLVFLEVIKELPITLILRPFGVNTLATKVFDLTSEGRWNEASYYALFILMIGLFALYISREKYE